MASVNHSMGHWGHVQRHTAPSPTRFFPKVDGFHEVLLRNAVPWGSSTQIMVSMRALHTMDRLQTIQTQRVKTYEHLWLSWIHQTYSNMLQTIGSKPKGPQIICLMGFSWFTGNSNAFTSSFITNGKQRETTSKIPWFLSYSFCQQWINEWKDARPDHIIPLTSLPVWGLWPQPRHPRCMGHHGILVA